MPCKLVQVVNKNGPGVCESVTFEAFTVVLLKIQVFRMIGLSDGKQFVMKRVILLWGLDALRQTRPYHSG